MKILVAILLWTLPLIAQSNTGELRLKVTDPDGLGVQSRIMLLSERNQYSETFVTDDVGAVAIKRLAFGEYLLEIDHPGFAHVAQAIEIRSVLPAEFTLQLRLQQANTTVNVTGQDTLIDPHRAGSVNQIGTDTITSRGTALPGRALQDLVNSQPGWLYEGNAVLHPRGSEYQTQFVLDGIPLTDNRSPSFGPAMEADGVQSMSIYTAGIPAEYGRKMGGVIEVNTARDTRNGLHGQVSLSGGSFDTAGAYAMLQYLRGKNTFGVTGDGAMTSRYLNPPVPENHTNTATTGDFAARYERDFTPRDLLGLTVRHALSRYDIPNEQIQQAAGQRQNSEIIENMGTVAYKHIFSSNVLADLRGMVRVNSNDLSSNALSTPIVAFQHNHFSEGYFKASVAVHHQNQEWKFGAESDSLWLREKFSYRITDPSRFDPATPGTFNFLGNRPDLEQSAYAQDLINFGNWTLSAGLRWDHYQLLVNQNALSPRLSLARYFTGPGLLIHASYDRVFQTPAFENILLSSSPQVAALNPNVLRLPVEPSHGNYYELGMTKAFFGQFSLDVNSFYRTANNFADDDQLLNTAISFPIAFLKGNVYGTEGKVNLPHWGPVSGYMSYSYMVGSVHFPVTGGLFLGDDATTARTELTGRFWNSQDQRNTVRTRFRYQIQPRLWTALGAQYGSGLPVDFTGTFEEALAEFGPQVTDRVNFDRGRVKPSLSVDASVGANVWKQDEKSATLQFDVANLNNRLNLIDFAGLFSGTAIAPPRSYMLRFEFSF